MTLPDYLEIAQGTAIIWGHPGGSGVTHDISVDNLTSGTARMGAVADLNSPFSDEYLVFLRVETGTAPTNGTTVDVHLVSNYTTTAYPAKVSGVDLAYTLGSGDANLMQAGPPVTSLMVTADTNTTLAQDGAIWRPAGRYVVPILVNRMNQNIRNQGTPANNTTRIILVPRRQTIVE